MPCNPGEGAPADCGCDRYTHEIALSEVQTRIGNLGRQIVATYREERVRRLAHEIWESEGHPHGRDTEHWRMATEAYEAELTGSRLDDAGQPIEVEFQATEAGTTGPPATAPEACRGRKPQSDSASPEVGTSPTAERKRRTKAEMAAVAAGLAGAAAAVAGTVAVTKRRRAAKTETPDAAAPRPAADVALRAPRETRSKVTLSEVEPASVTVASDAVAGAVPGPSGDRPSDVATGPFPDPGAEPPSDAVLDASPKSAPDADLSGERVAD